MIKKQIRHVIPLIFTLIFILSGTLVLFAETTKIGILRDNSKQASSAPTHSKPSLPDEKVLADTFPNGKVTTKKVTFLNGDTYWMKRFTFSEKSIQKQKLTLQVPGKDGTFTYVEGEKENKKWRTIPLRGTLPKKAGFISTNRYHVLVSYPAVYFPRNKHTLKESASSYPVKVVQEENGYRLNVEFPQKASSIGEMWALESKQPLIDWSDASVKNIWLNMDFGRERKWSWDGSYIQTPSTYIPTEKHLLWRTPLNYDALSFVITGGSAAAYDLGWVMLHTTLSTQKKEGYWETIPTSTLLWKNYGIGAGFYDTRFNTDHALALLYGYRKYKDPAFLQAAERYASWLIKYAEMEHIKVNGGQQEGWLVPDYYHPKQRTRALTSLNHQLAEIDYLYELYLETHQPLYREYAEKLLYGIKNTKQTWIKPDNNLQYALENGKPVKHDYQFLTYNDLWKTQRVLRITNGKLDSDLADLMLSKKTWMDRNQITGYIKRPLLLDMY